MQNNDHLSNGALFADLQTSLTEIVLLEMLDEHTEAEKFRLEGNERIVESIMATMKERFDEEQVRSFLDYGYPRRVSQR